MGGTKTTGQDHLDTLWENGDVIIKSSDHCQLTIPPQSQTFAARYGVTVKAGTLNGDYFGNFFKVEPKNEQVWTNFFGNDFKINIKQCRHGFEVWKGSIDLMKNLHPWIGTSDESGGQLKMQQMDFKDGDVLIKYQDDCSRTA